MLTLILLFACSDDFATAQAAGTIEAYEAYLAAHPSGARSMEARALLETLFLEKARNDKTLEAYDAYLTRFPNGDLHARMVEEREAFLWAWAKENNSPAAWERFMTEYPQTNPKRMAEARQLQRVSSYADGVQIGEVTISKVNLAEDPEGPLNGLGFRAKVTNTGDKTIASLVLTIQYLGNADGQVIGRAQWPVVAPRWIVPLSAETMAPLAPGESRDWWWTSEPPAPEHWSGKVTLEPARISFVE